MLEKAPPWAATLVLLPVGEEKEKEREKEPEIECRRDSKRRSVAQLARDHNIFRAPKESNVTRVSVRRFIKRSRAFATRERESVRAFLALDEERICRHRRSLRRQNRSAPAEPIVTQSVAWRACVQECDVNRPLPRRSVTRRRVISSRKSPLRAEEETRSEKRAAFLRFDDHAPRHTCGLFFSSRRRRSRPRRKIISCHFQRRST